MTDNEQDPQPVRARRAVEDMAAAHREQLAEARAATSKAADEAERWRAEAEAARAQVETLTAERDEAWRNALRHRAEADRYREALESILGDGMVFVAGTETAHANTFRSIAREALEGGA